MLQKIFLFTLLISIINPAATVPQHLPKINSPVKKISSKTTAKLKHLPAKQAALSRLKKVKFWTTGLLVIMLPCTTYYFIKKDNVAPVEKAEKQAEPGTVDDDKPIEENADQPITTTEPEQTSNTPKVQEHRNDDEIINITKNLEDPDCSGTTSDDKTPRAFEIPNIELRSITSGSGGSSSDLSAFSYPSSSSTTPCQSTPRITSSSPTAFLETINAESIDADKLAGLDGHVAEFKKIDDLMKNYLEQEDDASKQALIPNLKLKINHYVTTFKHAATACYDNNLRKSDIFAKIFTKKIYWSSITLPSNFASLLENVLKQKLTFQNNTNDKTLAYQDIEEDVKKEFTQAELIKEILEAQKNHILEKKKK